MSTQVQIRRGNTAQTAAFTGAIAELTVDTDKRVVVVHDGTTAGGNPLIKANSSITTGQILTSNGSHLLALSNTGTAGTYGNASFIPVVTTDAYGRVSSVTNTAIAISSGVVTGVMSFAQGGANATSYTTGQFLTSNGTAFVSVANTGTAGTYGNAAYHPVITTDAYGRVSGVTNTAVAIDTAAITSGTLADARLPTKGTAGTYGNTTYIPVVTTDAYGRVTAVTNTAIQSSTTSVQGIVQLTDSISSTSTTTAATPNSVKTAYDLATTANTNAVNAGTYANSAFAKANSANVIAQAAFDKANQTAQLAFTTVSANGTSLVADANNDTLTITSAVANGIFVSGNSSTDALDIGLINSGVTANGYGDSISVPTFVVDSKGRLTSASNTTIRSGTTSQTGVVQLQDSVTSTSTSNAATPASVKTAYDLATTANNNAVNAGTYANAAFTKANSANVLAQAAFDNSNTKFNSSGGSISGDVSVTGNLTIIGQTIYANTTTALIADNIITLNAAINQASAPTVDAGFEIDRGSSANVSLLWNETSDKWTFTNDGTTYFNIADAGRLDSVFSLANGTAGVANTDYTTLTASAGTYGNASHVTVTTLTANGRVSAITNTAIAIDTAAITSGTLADARLPATGTAGTYGNTTYVPVITTDSKGRVTAVTNTAISFPVTSVAGVTGAVSNTQLLNGILTVDGTGSGLDADKLDGLESASFANAAFANTDYTTISATAGVYGNASHVPVTTLTANGRVSLITNTAIAIDTAAITSGTLAVARGGTGVTSSTGTGSVVLNTSPILTTPNIGTPSFATLTNATGLPIVGGTTGTLTIARGGSNNTTYTTGAFLTSNGTAFVSVANTGTAGTYGSSTIIPVITTDAYGRVSAVTNTAIDGSALSGVVGARVAVLDDTASTNTYVSAMVLQSGSPSIIYRNTSGFSFNVNTNDSSVGGGLNGTFSAWNANVRSTTKSTSNSTGALRVSGGIGVTGNVYADAIYDGGVEVIAFANQAFTQANSANVLAQAAFDKANTDATNITATAGVYGNATIVPVITLTANGRVSSITNTVIQSATTSVQGIVQLNDTVTSTSTSVAATANAVNAVYNFASTKFNSSGGTISGDTTITGNLVVNGTTTTVNTSTVSTSDSLLKLANNNTAGDSLDIGFYGTYNATGQKYAGLVRQAGSNFFLFKDLTTDPTSNALATGSLTAANTATLRANITGGTVSSLASAIGVADGGTGATTLTAGRILIGSGTSAVTTLANTGTAATYANASHVPVITTDAYGRVSAVTNTAIAIDTAAITSGTIADARLPTKGTAGTYANASHVPVITTDAYGRVTAVTNTAIVISAAAITSGTLAVAQGGTGVTTSTGTGSVVLNTSPVLTTPNIGVPSFATLTNATGLPVSGITSSTSTALGVGSVELGHASDTTLSRSSAGVLAVEGVVVPTVSSTSTLTNKTLTFPIIDNIKMGFTSTATAAGTTTLTSASNHYQRFTGSTTQTVVLPVTSTLVAGVAYEIENASTGNLTVNSSGGNLVVTIIPGVTVQCRCIGTALTTAADWDPEYNEFAAITGTGAVVLNTSPTLVNVSVSSVNVTNTTVSTSNITGAITVSGGIGVKGNVSANGIIFDDGTRQTTAASGGGASIGDVLALSIALG